MQVWAHALDFNGAVRFTDYETSGSVTTWKAGLTFSPIYDVTFRGTLSHDIRAPNLQELYNAGAGGFPGVINPFRGKVSELTETSTLGNAGLGSGRVRLHRYRRRVACRASTPGFSASVDYWSLDIDKAIGTITAQQTLDQCFEGNATVCDAITLRPDNTIAMIRLQPFNLVAQKARGVDYEASYRLPMDSLISSWSGNLTFRVLATNFLENYSSNGINTPTDTAGQNTNNGPPNWRWNGSVVYSSEKISTSLTARGISSGTYLNSNIVCTLGLSGVERPTRAPLTTTASPARSTSMRRSLTSSAASRTSRARCT